MILTNQVKVSLQIQKRGFTYPDQRYIVTEYGNGYSDHLEVSKSKTSVVISSGMESTVIISPETIPMLIQELRRVYKQHNKEQENV